MRLYTAFVFCTAFFELAFAAKYSQYILAPTSRHLIPASVHQVNGSVGNAAGLTASSSGITYFGTGGTASYDYSKNIGGLVSFTVEETSDANQYIGISFSESSIWVSPNGSDATQSVGIDQTIWIQVTGPGSYTLPSRNNRGGFRYLNVYHNSTGVVGLSAIWTNFSAMPHWEDDALQNYTGYFNADNEKLNRVWYAAAYTDQLCVIPANEGDALPDASETNDTVPLFWWANSTLTNGTSALVDGAKRDKLIWPGDYGISVPGVFLSTNDAPSIRLSLETLFAQQNSSTGQLPYAANPIVLYPPEPSVTSTGEAYSFTYHLYSLIGLGNYYLYSGDVDFVKLQWERVKFAINLSLSSVDSTGLAYVPSDATSDWARYGMGAYNIEANSILYYVLNMLIQLSDAVSDTSQVANWTTYATNIRNAANDKLWSSNSTMYNDNTTTTLNPQDGNSWAILSGIADPSQASQISAALAARWTKYGAPAPEAGTTISPFISGFELQAHFLAGQPQRAIDLMELMWHDFMLDDPRMTNSTFIEGYDVSGELHYPNYADDARISHSHGWSTGPLIALSTYAAGLHVIDQSTWVVHPQLGNLRSIDVGFEIAAGAFNLTFVADTSRGTPVDGVGSYTFATPLGTSGSLIVDIPECDANINLVQSSGGEGSWHMHVPAHTGNRDAGIAWFGPASNGTGVVTFDALCGSDYTLEIACI